MTKMVTLIYDGCAWLGILKVFWKRKNIESRKKTIIAEAKPNLRQTDSFSRNKSWGKNELQKIFRTRKSMILKLSIWSIVTEIIRFELYKEIP